VCCGVKGDVGARCSPQGIIKEPLLLDLITSKAPLHLGCDLERAMQL
jgi:hypothetical protein